MVIRKDVSLQSWLVWLMDVLKHIRALVCRIRVGARLLSRSGAEPPGGRNAAGKGT